MSVGRIIALVDLDDSLFCSDRAMPEGAQLSWVGAVNAKGEPASFQTPQQRTLVELLLDKAHDIVPVTGRTSRAFARERILHQRVYSIVSHGGWIMFGNEVCTSWLNKIKPEADQYADTMSTALAAVDAFTKKTGDPLRFQLHYEGSSVPMYVSVKAGQALTRTCIDFLRALAELNGLKCHIGRCNAALLPPYTSKRRSSAYLLEHFLERQAEDTVVTIGDSLSDAGFMDLGDFAIHPTRGCAWQAFKTLTGVSEFLK